MLPSATSEHKQRIFSPRLRLGETLYVTENIDTSDFYEMRREARRVNRVGSALDDLKMSEVLLCELDILFWPVPTEAMSSKQAQVDVESANAFTGSSFYGAFEGQELQTLLSIAQKVSAPKGTVIVKSGEPQTFALAIESGSVEKCRGVDKRTLKAGETSGLMHFYNSDVASASLTALEDVTYLKFEGESFRKACDSSDKFNASWVHFLTREVRKRSNVLSVLSYLHGSSGKTKIAVFDAKPYFREAFAAQGASELEFVWISDYLSEKTAYMASGCKMVCIFVNDNCGTEVVTELHKIGVEMIALRCAGFDNVDLAKAVELGMSVTRVPAYSPYAVAEHTVALIMACNRKIHKSVQRIAQFNFSLSGLVGFDLNGKTVGIFGTGKIGICTINILRGFGCKIKCFDVVRNAEIEKIGESVKYVDRLEDLWPDCDIISLHAPLLPSTKHCINADSIAKCKKGFMLINTSRGPLVDTAALLDALISGQVGSAGLDVYEGEKGIFYEDKSDKVNTDKILSQLVSAHNVVLTSHQAFLTNEALAGISSSVIASIREFETGKRGKELTNFQGPLPQK